MGVQATPSEPGGTPDVGPGGAATLGPGVHVLVSADPIPDALRLARATRADLASTAIEAELAIDRRRRTLRARTLATRASEAGRLADLLAGSDVQADDALLECAGELHSLAAAPDPLPVAEAVRHAAIDLQRAGESLRQAEAAERATREAVEEARRRLAAHPARAAAEEPHRARSVADAVHRAADEVRRLENEQPPEPALDPAGTREATRASLRLEAARAEAARFRRRVGTRLVQASGVGLVLAGLALNEELPVSTVIAALVLPLVLVGLTMVRARRKVRAELRAAGRAATAVAFRLFPEAVPEEALGAGPDYVADPAEVERDARRRWEEHTPRLADAQAALHQAMSDWIDLAGPATNVDSLGEVLALAAESGAAEDALRAALADLDGHRAHLTATGEAWRRAVEAAGHPGAAPEQLPGVLGELRERQARRQVAAGRLASLRAAEERAAARTRLAGLLAGRSLGELDRAARRAAGDADPGVLGRPLVVVDAGPPTTTQRRRTLRRLLDDLDDATTVAIITGDEVAPEWDCSGSAGQLND